MNTDALESSGGKATDQTAAAAAPPLVKKAISRETFLFIAIFAILFGFIGSRMGGVNMVSTMLNTASDLLINTCFYIMAIAVVAGALAALLSEFGVIALFNRILSPLMKPLYGLPGASVVSVLTCYLSDNPAILTLCDDTGFRKYFKKYQLPALTNIGTAFGMGLIVTVFMMGLSGGGVSYVVPALLGNVGAIVGSIVSTRLFMIKSRKVLGDDPVVSASETGSYDILKYREVRPGSIGERVLNAALEGGSSGVKVGVSIIPGVLVICSLVMLLSNGVGAEGYTGAAYQGIALLPALADKISFILTPLFGFSDPSCVAVPITALGSAGAAIGIVPNMVAGGLANSNDVAVFTAMCMCWSGYLSTHVAMMDALKCRQLTGHAILSHTIGGLCAGIAAHLLYMLYAVII